MITQRVGPIVSITIALAALVGAPPPAAAQSNFNMSLVANLPLTTATDVSASGNLVFVGRSQSGASIVDVTNLASPIVLSTWVHPTNPQVGQSSLRFQRDGRTLRALCGEHQ
jgi:hypothetical protein